MSSNVQSGYILFLFLRDFAKEVDYHLLCRCIMLQDFQVSWFLFKDLRLAPSATCIPALSNLQHRLWTPTEQLKFILFAFKKSVIHVIPMDIFQRFRRSWSFLQPQVFVNPPGFDKFVEVLELISLQLLRLETWLRLVSILNRLRLPKSHSLRLRLIRHGIPRFDSSLDLLPRHLEVRL